MRQHRTKINPFDASVSIFLTGQRRRDRFRVEVGNKLL